MSDSEQDGKQNRPQQRERAAQQQAQGHDLPTAAFAEAQEPMTAPYEPPLHALQASAGNRVIARAMAARTLGPDEVMPEVGTAGGAISNRLATRIQQNLGGGAPLDPENQSRFEDAFGISLDTVRIHQGEEADRLNRSLGARAFTLGSDIFFSHDTGPGDRQLLAHEVTHVVQQRAMPGSGELAVGPAQDPLEHEAERSARVATLSPAPQQTPNPARATVQRAVAEDLQEFAALGEQEQREQMQERPPPAMQVHNLHDANAARRVLNDIEGYRPNMQDGGRTGTVSGDQISANEQAIAKLSDYLVTIGEQGRTLSTFQEHVQQVRLDYGRVGGQMVHLQAMGVVDPNQTAAYRAEQIVGAATGAMSAEGSAAGIRGDAVTERGQAQQAHDRLMEKGNDFSAAQESASRAVHGLNSALSNLSAGIIPREQNPDLAAQQRAIKAKVSTMQSRLATGLQVVSALGGAAGLGTAATAAATEAVGSAATGLAGQALGALSPDTIATAISEEWYREETNQVQAQIDQANAQSREAAITANVSQVREAQTTLFSAMRTLERKLTEYQQARDTLRTTLANLGAAADRNGGANRPGGGQGYTIIARLLGDVDVLSVQITTTMGLGRTEEHAAGHATEARGTIEGTRNEQTGQREGGVTYYRPYQTFQLANFGRSGGIVYRALPNRIYFITAERSPGSAFGGQGAANPVVRQTMEQLEEMRVTVQGMRDVLSRSLGLTMQR
jgi:hypothetical protein